jgi:AraC-like DNA-binding protein
VIQARHGSPHSASGRWRGRVTICPRPQARNCQRATCSPGSRGSMERRSGATWSGHGLRRGPQPEPHGRSSPPRTRRPPRFGCGRKGGRTGRRQHGWQRLQAAGGRITIGALAAELGVGRRRLETGFVREIGLTPKTVARIARFQDAVQVIAAPSGTFCAAAACGYADQPHFNREIRAMAGITPSELRAFVQYTDRLPG